MHIHFITRRPHARSPSAETPLTTNRSGSLISELIPRFQPL
jgi:hypothetical protein